MSYDLMVFSPSSAPQERAAFMVWYEKQTEWAEGHSYDDPAVSTPDLRSWFLDVIKEFPPMNGPLASAEIPLDEGSVTDFSIGKFVIYGAFAWSKAERANKTVKALAAKHSLGFFDLTDEGTLWLPDGRGDLRLMG